MKTHLLKYLLTATLAMLSFSKSFAYEFEYTSASLTVDGGTFFYGAVDSIDDGLLSNRKYGDTRAIVSLGIDWSIVNFNATFPVDSQYVVEIIVNIKGWDPTVATPDNGNYTTNETETLTVIYYPIQNVTEMDLSTYTFTNVRKVRSTITAITVNGTPVTNTADPLPQPLYLKTDLVVDRYRNLSTSAPTASTVTDLNNNQVRFTWIGVIGAEEYDVEWTWVDEYANPQEYDFARNSSRVTLPASDGTSYILPASYPSGTIITRVRARGRDTSDLTITEYGPWSLATTGTVASVGSSSKHTLSTGLEEDMNWQFTTTFSENGKRQDVIQYFDGTLRNRQSITRLNVLDSAALVGETYYDYIGRPSIQVLPVPHIGTDTSYNHLQYRSKFNRDDDDNQFTYNDFDTNAVDACDEIVVNPMSTDYGASYYYSDNNPLIGSDYGNIYNYLPDANGYPFTQVEFMPDNTGRIRRQSGVGITHRLTGEDKDETAYTGKETQYFYGTPFQEQLDRLFGNEVGLYKHYKKNLVIDGNGQVSVSYLDPYGRVIATALAGDASNAPNLTELESASDTVVLNCTLNDSMDIDYNNRSIRSTATHLVTNPGTHSITYSIATPSYAECLPVDWCFDCVYDLTISVKDECGTEMISGGPITERVGNINTTCDSLTFTTTPDPVEVDLTDVGSYVITKELTVNDSALNYYVDQYLENSTCLLPLDSFLVDAMANIDTTQCYGDCDDCLDRLGDYADHSDTSKIYTPGYDYMTQDEYDEAVAECNALCDTKTQCDGLYEQILNDVSPGGQYMEFELDSFAYSVTDSLSLLNTSYAGLGDYTELSGYLDYNGDTSVITIGGFEYHAENLPVNLFIQNWETSWAETLAPLHPEYCYYERCLANEDSYLYDMNMMNTETFDAAQDSGFVNPIGSYSDTTEFRYEHRDPYFDPWSGSLYDQMADALDDYVGTDTSAWDLVNTMQVEQASSHAGEECWTDYDWGLFRAVYLSEKQEIVANNYDTMANCVDWGGYPNDAFDLGIKTPRFVFDAFESLGNDSLTHYSITSTSSSSPQDISDEAMDFIDGWCDTICNGYADQWMYELRLCSGLTGADSIEVRERLVFACQGNCNSEKPLGGIEQSQVDYILEDVLGSSYANDTCNAISIVQPVNSGPGAYGLVPMDTCACNNVLDAHIQYDTLVATSSLPAGVCSEQDYFTYLYGDDAAGVDFDQLECYCYTRGWIDSDEIVTPTTVGNVTTLVAPNCSMYTQYYVLQSNLGLGYLVEDMVSLFNVHWYADSCVESTFAIDDLPLSPNWLETGCENCIDSFTTAKFSEMGSQRSLIFTIHDDCNSDCDFAVGDYDVSSPAIGNCKNSDTLYHNLPLSSYSLDSMAAALGGYESPHGNGIYYSNLPGEHESSTAYYYFWTDCFHTNAAYYQCAQEFDTLMYVPYGLACDQCLDCANIDTAYVHMLNDYPFVDDLTDTIAVVHYLTDYINQSYNHNFNFTQVVDMIIQCDSSSSPGELEFCYEPMFTVEHDEHQECIDFLLATATSNAESQYNAYLDSVTAAITDAYINKCLSATETFEMEYTEQEYHYTLYYYDQAGNLIKTVPPAGVIPITSSDVLDTVRWHRDDPSSYPRITPDHEKITDYKYSTLNQPSRQHTPDGGATEYWYDILGRLVVSQNAEQAIDTLFSYTIYDDLGRIIEVGQTHHDTTMTPANAANQGYLDQWITAGDRTQVTSTFYDEAIIGAPMPFTDNTQYNLRNRVATITYEEVYKVTDTIFDVATHYSYDIHGNVTELVQEVVGLKGQDARYKHMKYEYDLVSGKVLEVKYQEGEKDQFFHRYTYTHDNKLVKAETSRDYVNWDEDATYEYYMYGALARTELGDLQVQGLDYAYTIHGWIKGLNSNTLDPSRDIGKDGYDPTSGTNAHEQFARDIAGYNLGYYQDTDGSTVTDYQSIGSFNVADFFIASIDTVTNIIDDNQASLFNGNISHMITSLPNCSTFAASQTFSADPLGTVYNYDQLNRINWMKAYYDPSNVVSLNRWGTSTTNDGETYYTHFDYDANGNLTDLGRWGDDSDSLLMDSLHYRYQDNTDPYYDSESTNRLGRVYESQTSEGRYDNDIDNTSTYTYDAIGNLTGDTGEDINEIEWTVYGKVKKVTRTTGSTKPDLEFKYNAAGQRYLKIEKPRNSGGILNQGNWTYTYYTHDAQGNIMAMYTLDYEETSEDNFDENYKVRNFNLYGSNRLGIKEDTMLLYQNELEIDTWGADSAFATHTATPVTLASLNENNLYRITGYKQYEIANHLGNVLATVTDRKVPTEDATHDTIVDYWDADINTVTDYYPFGFQVPGRNLASPNCVTAIEMERDSTWYYEDWADSSSNTSNQWTTTNSTLTVTSGQLKVDYVAGSGIPVGAYIVWVVEEGREYELSFTASSACSSGCGAGLYDGVPYASAIQHFSLSTHTYTFTAPNDTVSFAFGGLDTTVSYYLDEIGLYRLVGVPVADCGSDTNSYIFGFNGKEKDGEYYGEGNLYDYGFRIYNPRIGRFLSVDPLFKSFPWYTPYQFSGNKPIMCSDIDGREDRIEIWGQGANNKPVLMVSTDYDEPGDQGVGTLVLVKMPTGKVQFTFNQQVLVRVQNTDDDGNPNGTYSSTSVPVLTKGTLTQYQFNQLLGKYGLKVLSDAARITERQEGPQVYGSASETSGRSNNQGNDEDHQRGGTIWPKVVGLACRICGCCGSNDDQGVEGPKNKKSEPVAEKKVDIYGYGDGVTDTNVYEVFGDGVNDTNYTIVNFPASASKVVSKDEWIKSQEGPKRANPN